MALSFTKLKSAGLPRTSAKFTKLAKARKPFSLSAIKPKVPTDKKLKDYDFNKFTKAPKLPKAAKLAIVKKAIKKAKKNVGF